MKGNVPSSLLEAADDRAKEIQRIAKRTRARNRKVSTNSDLEISTLGCRGEVAFGWLMGDHHQYRLGAVRPYSGDSGVDVVVRGRPVQVKTRYANRPHDRFLVYGGLISPWGALVIEHDRRAGVYEVLGVIGWDQYMAVRVFYEDLPRPCWGCPVSAMMSPEAWMEAIDGPSESRVFAGM